MDGIKIIVFGRKHILLAFAAVVAALLISAAIIRFTAPADLFSDPGSGIIVIDPGHGGIDGGANSGGILEKDVNLAVAKMLKADLEGKSYKSS